MSNSRFNRFLNGKGFYVALGICMIAIGVSAWAAIDKASTPPDDILSSDTAQFVSDESSSSFEEEANKEQEGVEDEREESSFISEDYSDNSKENDIADDENVSSSVTKAPTAEYFVYPVEGEVIKEFSATELMFSATFNDMRLHKGIDIKADTGAEIKSAGDGTVLEVVNDPNLGYTVRIDHGNGIVVAYGGLNKEILVEATDVVSAGTVLGTLGTVNNECLDAPHLHLEFLKDGQMVDPLGFLK